MSGSFTGFSEDYIRKLGAGNEECSTKSRSTGIHGNLDNLPGKQEKSNNNLLNKQEKSDKTKNVVKEEKRHAILNEKIENSKIEPINENAKLTKNPENIATMVISTLRKEETQTEETQTHLLHSTLVVQETPPQRLNLEVAQARQKLIEEQNKKRKELLSKVLADKTKKTLAETQKLKEIQSELQKLDSLHSSDINILRKQIELASLDYMEAEKRYFKVEKEFLNAKLDLQLKSERKELLAEHLCAIIEKNEERKAEKLNEMLSKLNLNIETKSSNNQENSSNSSKEES